MPADPAVKIETLCAVLGVSTDTVNRRQRSGQIPTFDFYGRHNAGWKLSTLQSWSPPIAAKLARGIELEVFPFLIAA